MHALCTTPFSTLAPRKGPNSRFQIPPPPLSFCLSFEHLTGTTYVVFDRKWIDRVANRKVCKERCNLCYVLPFFPSFSRFVVIVEEEDSSDPFIFTDKRDSSVCTRDSPTYSSFSVPFRPTFFSSNRLLIVNFEVYRSLNNKAEIHLDANLLYELQASRRLSNR